jgi:cardiolipin synthase
VTVSVERLAVVTAYIGAAVLAGGHALLHKRDPRSAWGWIAVCWLFPLAGAVLYYLFGFNRVQTRAARVFGRGTVPSPVAVPDPALLRSGLDSASVRELVRIGWALSAAPLVEGCSVRAHHTGAEAYAAMLDAIRAARSSVHLASYIFRDDRAGQAFAAALADAQARGVTVRVLLDGVADSVYRPRGSTMLRRRGVGATLFLPPRVWPPMLHINLRNHRKMLIVDGATAFTGGMNIQQDHVAGAGALARITDIHFGIAGPLVEQMDDIFRADWRFAAGEEIKRDPPAAAAASPATGDVVGRVLVDGPNEDLDRLVLVLIGALSAAHVRVWIMTPYFLPTAALVSALQSAALRGVDVRIVLPQKSDQAWTKWATEHMLLRLLRRQVRVFRRPPPFAHSKLFLVDDWYVQFGSANLDPRSLRLNFELVVESYSRPLAAEMAQHFDSVLAESREATADEMLLRPFLVRLRDACCWLFSPYL